MENPQLTRQDMKTLLSRRNNPLSSLTYTVTTSSTTPAIPATANYALIQVESQEAVPDTGFLLRYWTSGDTPTTTQGFGRGHGSGFDILNAASLSRLKVIKVSSDDVVLQIEFYK